MTNSLQRYLGFVVLVSATAVLIAQTSPDTAASKKVVQKKATVVQSDPGERAFQSNCSRCHYAPESLPPRITGTVVRHMRVRANLSAKDERLILSYFNP
jgi:cytochrome c5